jgi:hypothetical protein
MLLVDLVVEIMLEILLVLPALVMAAIHQQLLTRQDWQADKVSLF